MSECPNKIFQENHQSVKQFGGKIGPDLGINCLQRLSADNNSWQKVKIIKM